MIPTWKTEEKDKNLKNGQKWLKIVQLKSPETPFYEFSQRYGY